MLVILFIAVVLLILFHDRIRRMKLFRTNEQKAAERAARKAAKEEEYFRRTSQKHYRKEEKPNFSKDYFRSADQAKEAKARKRTKKEDTTRETTHSDGVTIIDERQPTARTDTKEKKIFDDSEGEYVEYEEV